MDRKTYDNALNDGLLEIKAPYYNAINPTSVFFENEKVSVSMDSLGHIEFFDENENSLGFVDFPVSSDPSKYAHTAQYGEIRCLAIDNEIVIYLPVYWWSDSYPDCDGEYDRWTRHISRWFRVVFNCKSKEISVLDK